MNFSLLRFESEQISSPLQKENFKECLREYFVKNGTFNREMSYQYLGLIAHIYDQQRLRLSKYM